MLTLEKLLEKLNKSKLDIFGVKGSPNLYFSANIVSGTYPLQCNNLYICPASKLNDLIIWDSTIGLVLIPDLDLEESMKLDCEFVIWDELVSFEELFQLIQTVFSREIEHSANITLLYSTLMNGQGIEGIIKIASKILNNPIIVTNSSYKVMGMTSLEKEIDDPVWQFAQKNGYCSQESIAIFKQEKITARTMESDGPIVLRNGMAKEIPRIIKKIIIGNKVAGYIGVFEINKEFENSDLELVTLFSEILGVEMKHNISEENFTDIIHESIVIDLLNNVVPSIRVLENRLKAAQWSLKSLFYVVEVPLSKHDDSIWFFDYLYTKLKNCTHLAKTLRYHDSIIMVINCDYEIEFEKVIDSIKMILEKNHIRAGVSRAFRSLNELKTHYHQACKALELGKLIGNNRECIYEYEDYAIFHLFSKIEDKEELKGLAHPAYTMLQEYDKLNGTDFCNTLYQFIMNAASVSDSADKLFIHRNTMSYRLSKIGKITGVDLTNGENIFRLYLSIKINQWLGV